MNLIISSPTYLSSLNSAAKENWLAEQFTETKKEGKNSIQPKTQKQKTTAWPCYRTNKRQTQKASQYQRR